MKRFAISALALATACLAPIAVSGAAQAEAIHNIVIVHGAFADGSGWQAVSDRLAARGYHVTIVQEPLTSLADDVAATKRVLALQDGPVLLVGHSYGGMVISDAGNDAKVKGLVYVAAFEPAAGESVISLASSQPDPKANPKAIQATADGFLYLEPKAFRVAFAADVPAGTTDAMASSQVFAAAAAFTAKAGGPAWATKPSWALVAGEDRSINPQLERDMAKRAGSHVREIASSHAVFLSHPDDVTNLILEAAKGVSQ